MEYWLELSAWSAKLGTGSGCGSTRSIQIDFFSYQREDCSLKKTNISGEISIGTCEKKNIMMKWERKSMNPDFIEVDCKRCFCNTFPEFTCRSVTKN